MSERILTRSSEDENLSRAGLGTEFDVPTANPTDRQVTEIGARSLRALQPFEITGLGALDIASEVTDDRADPTFRQSHTNAGLTKTCCC